MRFLLRAKLFLVILLGVMIPMGGLLFFLRRGYSHTLSEAFVRQGRAMVGQVLVTRRWLSMHGGVYVIKQPFIKSSPYLDDVDTYTAAGDPITLRSPDIVTREISQLAGASGPFRFHIMSNTPINPDNLSNPWEQGCLLRFEQGATEAYMTSGDGRQAVFHFMAPLFTEASCLRCHQELGYKVGNVRGGIAVEFPVGDMLAAARHESGNLAFGFFLIGAAIVITFWIGANRIVLRPLSAVTGGISAMAAGNYDYPLKPRTNDELGDLTRAMIDMRRTIRDYKQNLEQEVQSRTRELETMRGRAQSERDYLINLFERMADGVCVTSAAEHNLEYINPSLAATLGDNRAAICRNIFDRPEPALSALPEMPELIHREVPAPGGRVFDVLASEMKNPDGTLSWLLVFRDISQRKKLEEMLLEMNRTLEAKVREQTSAMVEQEKLATLGEVSAGLAHEIRNPLSAILSGISLLQTSQRTVEERERILQLIKREAGRLNASLTDFLLFARPQEPKRVRIDLARLIREIVNLIEDDPEIKGDTEIILDLVELPPVYFDDDQLRQLLWNVALNALQAMKGQGRLIFRTRQEGEHGWRLEIEDTGPGVPDNIRERIYDPFFSTKKDGTGLGLSIVRRIVTSHGGTVKVETPEAGGTRFAITIPRHKDEV